VAVAAPSALMNSRRFTSVPLNDWLDEFDRKETRGKGQ
jgi:hypothetical protein